MRRKLVVATLAAGLIIGSLVGGVGGLAGTASADPCSLLDIHDLLGLIDGCVLPGTSVVCILGDIDLGTLGHICVIGGIDGDDNGDDNGDDEGEEDENGPPGHENDSPGHEKHEGHGGHGND